jgi:hypothetical protein
MICDRCKKNYERPDMYHCGGCGAVLCRDCLKTVEKQQKDHPDDYCSFCWKSEEAENG